MVWVNPCGIFSMLTWIIGKIFALNGYFITSIVFEATSKMSGRRRYAVLTKA